MVQPPAIPPITLPTMLWNIEESPRHNADSQVVVESSRVQIEKHLETISDLKVNLIIVIIFLLYFK